MATKGGQIEFDVGFNVNSESLKAVREELKSIQSMTTNDIVSSDPYSKIKQGLRDAQDAARDLDNILQDSFNQDLGVMNITKFQQGIERSYGSLNTLQAKLSGAGDVGTIAFRKICTEIITTNSYIKKTDALISKIATTLGNTLKWNISSSIINRMTGSIQEAWGYTKALDSSLNNIQIVTNKSSEDMAKFAIQANDAAKALKTTTTAYTDAALTFYQQGLSDEDVAARAETSLKVSNVTGLSGDQSAEYVTAVLNGYKVAAEDAEEAMDKLAAVGAATASSLAELSEAMAKVASAANAMGVSEDQLAATLSTVISVTRQDASTVGTAFKTIYARISDIKAGSEEAEISLGNYTKKMAEMGFSVLDSTGNMRDLGEVIEEIGGKWATLSREQQISLAQTMAGTRQYNNLIALFDNWAEYEDALNVSMQANGTLQKQQEIYAESLAAKLKEVKAAKEDLFDSLINTDSFKNLLDIFTKLINVLSTFVDSIGGGGTALAYLGSILTKVFNKQIAGSIQNLVTNLNGIKQNAENAAAKMQLLREMTLNNDPYVANFAKAYEEQLPLMNSVSERTREIMTATLEAKAAIDAEAESYDKAQQEIEDYFKAKTKGEDYQGIDEKGKFNQKQNNQLNAFLDEEKENFSSIGEEISALEESYQRLQELEESPKKGRKKGKVNREIEKLKSELKSIDVSELQKKLNDIEWNILPDDIKQQAQSLINQINSEVEKNGALDIENLMGLTDSDTKENIISILSGIFEQAGVKFETKIEEMKQQASEDGQQRGVNIRANQQQAEENQQNVLDAAKLEAKIQKYTDLASSVMGVVGAIQTLQNLGNIWNNEDISIGEKITQTAMALSMALTTLIPALKTLIGLEKVKAAWDIVLAKTGGSVLAASLALVAVFAALTMAIVGIVNLLNKNVEANKRAAEAAQEAADSAHEQTEALREEKEAIDAVVSGYEELYDQYKNGQITLEELRQKTYDLCMQYGEEDLALKALIADQEELNRLMKEAQSEADSKLYEQSKTEADYDKDAIKRGIMADAGKREDSFGYGTSTIDLKGMSARNIDEIDFAEALEKAGIIFENADHINTDSLINAYTENYDELMRILSKYSDLDAAQQIGEYLDNQKDNLDKYKEAVDTEAQLYLENELKSRYDTEKGFTEGQNFHTATTESATKATEEKYGIRTEDNAEDWDAYYAERLEAAQDYYAQYTELANAARIEDINNALAATRAIKDGMEISQEELNYIYMHLETAEAYNDLNEFLRVYEKDIKIANSKTILLELDAQLSDPDKEAFTDEELATYFGLDGFQDAINMSLEQLKGIDFKDQKIALMGATQKMKSELLDSYTEAMKTNQEELQNISDKLNDSEVRHNSFLKNKYQNFIDEMGTSPQEALNEIEDFEAKRQEIENKYADRANDSNVKKQEIEALKQEYDSILNLEQAYGDLDAAKEAITYDSGAEDYYSYLEVEQELQALQAQGIELNDIETTQQLQEQQTALQKNIEKSKSEIESLKSEIISMNEVAANSAQSLRDLNDLKEQGAFIDIEGTTENEGKAAYNKRAEELYEAARMEDLDSEEVRDYAHSLKDVADNSEELSDDLKDNLEDCQDLAVQIKRMNKGIDTLSENWDEWSDILKNSSKESEEYADAMTGSKEAMADLLDVTEEFISDNFVTENMEDIAKAAEGDADAIDKLRASMLEDIVMHLDLDDSALSNEQLLGQVNNLQSMLDSMGDLQVGAEIDDASFIAACNEMIASAGLTSDQVNALFSGMGFDANFSSETEPVPAKIPEYTVHHEPIVKGYANIGDGPSVPIYDEVTWTEQTGEHIAEGEAAAFAMTTDGSTPVINSVTKKAGGSMNNASSSNKGGGEKGGGGSKAKEPDKMDKIDNTIDRYHDINIEIKQLETAYDRLGKAQDKLVGQDLVNNLNQQLKILEKQIDAYQRKLTLERQEAAELQGDLSGKGVTFNADGTISNYAESLKAQEDYVNSLIEKYNNMSAEEQEAYKEVVEQAKEDFEKFKENIERYDTIITDEIPGLEDQIQDAFDQQIEINIKKFTMSVELRLEMKQAEEDWNKFKRKIIDSIKDENILGQGLEEFENLKDYFDLGDGTGTVQTLTNQVNNTMAEIEKIQNGGISDVYGDNLATALEDLQKYNTELMTQLEDIDDLIADIEQGYLDTMDEVSENMKKQVESYEYINDLIESDIELVKLLYGEDAYDSLGAYYSQKHDNYLKAIDFDRKEVDFWETEMNKAKQAGDTEVYNKALEKYRESISRLNEDVNSSVQNIIDQYSNAINKIFDNLDKKFTGGQGLEFMQEEWELINANADRYLDTINSTYEVQKLQSKYQDAINNTDSISAQKKLNALMEEEIGMLEKKDKLSQYDIDRANMKYEIALKQIALEEAQKNKSSMKMKRDAQGNYSYVYAGDEEDISAKQQELADAQNQLYNLDKEQYQQNLNDMMSYYADFTDKYKELMLDTTLSDEEREKKKAMLIEQYGALINSIQTDNETIRRNLSESTFDMLDVLYETDAISFELMTGLNANNWETMSDVMINKIQTDLVPSWESGIQEMINLITEEGGLEPTCKEAFEEIEQSVEDFKNKLVEVQDAAKISFDEISNGQDNTLDKNKELLEDNEQLIKDAQEQLEEYQKLRTEVENLAKAYDAVRDAAMRAAQAAHTLAEEINTQSANAKNDSIVGPNMPSNSSNGAGGANSGGSNNGGGNGSNNGGSNNTGSGSSSSSNTSSQTKKYYVTASHPSYGTIKTFGGPFASRGEAETYIVTHESRLKSNGVLYKAPTIVEKYKTGGYTGNWTGGSDEDGGKLAFLHQKELVLNAEDTENYLQAVQEMRKLQSEVQNGTSMNILGNIFDAIADSINIRIADLQRQAERSDFRRSEFGLERSSMSQNIVINADFPDVSDAAEIQKAFDQILGMASQKANNKSR